MEEMQLLPFRNGKYLINNVPHQLKKGVPFLDSGALMKIAELTDYMLEHSVFETDFKNGNESNLEIDDRELRKIAKFELNRYPTYCKQSKEGTEEEQRQAKEKIAFLEKVVDELKNYRGKEIIRQRFFYECNRDFKDDFIVMKELKIGRSVYYDEKSDALKEVGLSMCGGLDK